MRHSHTLQSSRRLWCPAMQGACPSLRWCRSRLAGTTFRLCSMLTWMHMLHSALHTRRRSASSCRPRSKHPTATPAKLTHGAPARPSIFNRPGLLHSASSVSRRGTNLRLLMWSEQASAAAAAASADQTLTAKLWTILVRSLTPLPMRNKRRLRRHVMLAAKRQAVQRQPPAAHAGVFCLPKHSNATQTPASQCQQSADMPMVVTQLRAPASSRTLKASSQAQAAQHTAALRLCCHQHSRQLRLFSSSARQGQLQLSNMQALCMLQLQRCHLRTAAWSMCGSSCRHQAMVMWRQQRRHTRQHQASMRRAGATHPG